MTNVLKKSEQIKVSSESGIDVREDFLKIKESLIRIGKWDEFTELMKPNTFKSLLDFLENILLILIPPLIIYGSPYYLIPIVFVVSIPLVSSGIRGIGNQCHDACHNNIFKSKEANRLFGKYILFPLACYRYNDYCNDHWSHHRHLGSMDKDMEKICRKIVIDKTSSNTIKKFWTLYKPFLLDRQLWKSSILGDLSNLWNRFTFKIYISWLVFVAFLIVLFGVQYVILFMVTLFFCKGTGYHAIKVFCELCDHYGLEEDSVISYTRSMPKNALSFILHPQNDNFHIAHHLFSNIPMPNLKKAHAILLKVEEYANAQILTSYFSGPNSVIHSLTK